MTGAAALDAASAEGAAAIAALPDLPPADAGTVLRDGTAIAYAAWGAGDRTLLLLPAWQVVDSTIWAAQIRRFAPVARVVTFDARGSGRSGRPTAAGAYAPAETIADALAVLDRLGVREADIAGVSFGGHCAALMAARHPDRVRRAVLMAPTAPFGPHNQAMTPAGFRAERTAWEGWDTFNAACWRADLPRFVRFFAEQCFPEPGSDDLIAATIAAGARLDPEILIRTVADRAAEPGQGEEAYRAVGRPVLVIQGDADRINPPAKARLVADLTGGRLVSIQGAGHGLPLRHPDAVDRELADFLGLALPAP